MKPLLYIFVGYPGSGKTSAALELAKLTGAEHLWADKIRREEIKEPSYSHQENLALYEEMNNQAAELLKSGRSVVFDTAFNFYKDRQYLREVALKNGASYKVIWVKTDRTLAKERALAGHSEPNRPVGHDMTAADFERMADSLDPPHPDEEYIVLDGTKITRDYVASQLNLHEND